MLIISHSSMYPVLLMAIIQSMVIMACQFCCDTYEFHM